MSVVVIRDGILYTDSVAMLAPCSYKKKIEKRVLDPQGDLVYAICGSLPRKKDLPAFIAQAREWFQNWYFGACEEGTPPVDTVKGFTQDSWVIVAWNDGYICYKWGKVSVHEIDDPIDGGDGGTFTMAGLDLGLRGDELEHLVNVCHPSSGLGIVETDLRALLDPINEKGIVAGSVEPFHVDPPAVDTEWATLCFGGGEVGFSLHQPLPWRNTSRVEPNFDDLYTDYGYFIPWGSFSRPLNEFLQTGHIDHMIPGQGTSGGIIISSDGMIYEMSFFGLNLEGFAESLSRPGFIEAKPVWQWWDGFKMVKGNGWNREYTDALVRHGTPLRTAVEMAHERFASPNPSTYRFLNVQDILDELKKRGTKPLSKTKLRTIIDFNVVAKHYKAIDRLFTEAQKDKYKL